MIQTQTAAKTSYIVCRDARKFIPFYLTLPGKNPHMFVPKKFRSVGEELLTFQMLTQIHNLFQSDGRLAGRELQITVPPAKWPGTLEDWFYTQVGLNPLEEDYAPTFGILAS